MQRKHNQSILTDGQRFDVTLYSAEGASLESIEVIAKDLREARAKADHYLNKNINADYHQVRAL